MFLSSYLVNFDVFPKVPLSVLSQSGPSLSPQLLLEAPDDIYCFKFCPTDPNIIAGGCVNGQVVLWDISAHVERLKTQRGTNKRKNMNSLVSILMVIIIIIPSILMFTITLLFLQYWDAAFRSLYFLCKHLDISGGKAA